jgi:glutamate 5-kinase
MTLDGFSSPSTVTSISLTYQRVVVKAGTNVLTGRSAALDTKVMASLVDQVVELRRLGAQVVLVTSGAIAAGRQALGAPRSQSGTTTDSQQMAAVGQGLLMHRYQELFSQSKTIVAQALLTRHDLEDRQGYLNVRNTLEGLLDRSVVPVVNENDVVNVEEISEEGFGDNDQLSTLVANLVDADLLVMLTDAGGLYTADPHHDPSAKLIPVVERIDEAILSHSAPVLGHTEGGAGRGGMRSKLKAARLATSFGVTVVIAGAAEGVLRRASAGEPVGTLFPTRTSRMESRKRWMLSGLADGKGAVVVDEGAMEALQTRNRSLLPSGVREVRGQFQRGDLVTILNTPGERLACGIANYGHEDLRAIIGMKSSQILQRLGHHFGDEVVHRNNMVVL